MKTFTHREQGKKWELPEVVYFYDSEIPTPHFYVVDRYRCPKQGEYYLSGSQKNGYQAPNDLNTKYLVVGFLKKAVQVTIWVASLD